MKSIILFDPSYGTQNMGDFIINEAIMKEMSFLFDPNFTIRYGTHNPLLHSLQMIRKNEVSLACNQSAYKFLGGTNLLKLDLMHITQGWNINILTSALYKGSVALGCGVDGIYTRVPNLYTKSLYRRTLDPHLIHSVRDEQAKTFLEELGFKAANTGCPTLWGFDKDLNDSIPKTKARNVVFTLTDYKPDLDKDQKLINLLNDNYDCVSYWVQGSGDYSYLKQFDNIDNIKLISPSLESYRHVLKEGDIDYVGTRLHAGIFAMQHKIRSVIIAVDNRTRDMNDSHNLNVVERKDVEKLPEILAGSITTKVFIDHAVVRSWKDQFSPNDKERGAF